MCSSRSTLEPYQATLDERQAELARARARLALASATRSERERLVKAQAISREEFDTRLTGLGGARGRIGRGGGGARR